VGLAHVPSGCNLGGTGERLVMGHLRVPGVKNCRVLASGFGKGLAVMA